MNKNKGVDVKLEYSWFKEVYLSQIIKFLNEEEK